MLILILGVTALLMGYLFYSKVLVKTVLPYKEPTPAISINDGSDYVPLSKNKNLLIQLLNIAGTGPIFGALMGAKWGPIVFFWIILGTIFGGAVHDYMSGMMSMRNNGESITGIITRYLGKQTRYPILFLLIFLMIMVSATFARSAGDLLSDLSGIPTTYWIIVILIYFVASAVIPIHKLIGRIYPIFGILLIIMAVTVIGGLIVGGYTFPDFTLENLHPKGDQYFPDMFITVACGAISGFHATQAPMVSRCTKNEEDGRIIFYGAMVIESVIALIWALAGLSFYGNTLDLSLALTEEGSSGVVYDIAVGVAGPVGGILAVIGVIVCPITSGDTAVRSARMMVQDDRGLDTTDMKSAIIITGVLIAFVIILASMDFTVLWNYFSWLNQTLACIVLWTATVFLLKTARKKLYSLITAIPAIFMTSVVSSFALHSKLLAGLDYDLAIMTGNLITVAMLVIYLVALFRTRSNASTA